jgi:hypothetical protein
MKKLIADISQKVDGGLRQRFYCESCDGQLDRAATATLLMLISESAPFSYAGLEALIAEAEVGHYVQPDTSLPDWSVNEKNLWVVAPMARPGHICISNEYLDEYSSDEGGCPQQFTYEQFRVALKFWRNFMETVTREGKGSLVDWRSELPFP